MELAEEVSVSEPESMIISSSIRADEYSKVKWKRKIVRIFLQSKEKGLKNRFFLGKKKKKWSFSSFRYLFSGPKFRSQINHSEWRIREKQKFHNIQSSARFFLVSYLSKYAFKLLARWLAFKADSWYPRQDNQDADKDSLFLVLAGYLSTEKTLSFVD